MEGNVTPVYSSLKGWATDINNNSTYEELPLELKNYINLIEESVGVPIKLVSYGPDRVDTIIR